MNFVLVTRASDKQVAVPIEIMDDHLDDRYAVAVILWEGYKALRRVKDIYEEATSESQSED